MKYGKLVYLNGFFGYFDNGETTFMASSFLPRGMKVSKIRSSLLEERLCKGKNLLIWEQILSFKNWFPLSIKEKMKMTDCFHGSVFVNFKRGTSFTQAELGKGQVKKYKNTVDSRYLDFGYLK